MKPNKTLIVTFSPTRTSFKIGKAIAHGLSMDSGEVLDLTLLSEIEEIKVSKDTLVIFALPVYGGAVAPLAMERLSKLKADGALAVAVVLYGNRAFENALSQIETFVTQRGCRVIAAGGFVGEHSYSTSQYPIAVGRPNDKDISFAHSFGLEIKKKIETADNIENIVAVDSTKISLPEQSGEEMIAFFTEVKQAIVGGFPSPKGTSVDESLCNGCGICAENCPTHAINPDNGFMADYEKCIKCCACVKSCPSQARYIKTPFAPLLSKYFKREKKNVIIV